MWGHTPLVPASGKQKQAELCELKAGLINIVSSRLQSETLCVCVWGGDPKNKKKPKMDHLALT